MIASLGSSNSEALMFNIQKLICTDKVKVSRLSDQISNLSIGKTNLSNLIQRQQQCKERRVVIGRPPSKQSWEPKNNQPIVIPPLTQ